MAASSQRGEDGEASASELVRDRLRRILVLYREIARDQPTEGRWWARIAETHRALGEASAAARASREAAVVFARNGGQLEALAACTAALALAPGDPETRRLFDSLVVGVATSVRPPTPSRAASSPTIPPTPRASLPAGSPEHADERAWIELPSSLPPVPATVAPTPVLPGASRDRDSAERISLEQLGLANMLPARAAATPFGTAEYDLGSGDDTDAGYEELSADEVIVEPDHPLRGHGPPAVPSAARSSAPRSTAVDAARLKGIPLLGQLPADGLEAILRGAEHRNAAPGDQIVHEGDVADHVFLVVRGDLVATRGQPPRPLARLGEGSFFGEMALLDDTPRSATVTAVTDAELLALPRGLVLDVCERHPAVLANLLRSLRARLIATLASSSPLFAHLPNHARAAVVAEFRLREIDPGTALVSRGQHAEALYVLLTGRADVTVDARVVAELTTGDVAGEASLLAHAPAEVTVRARSWVTALVLPAAELARLIETHPGMLAPLAELAAAERVAVQRSPGDSRGGARSLRRV